MNIGLWKKGARGGNMVSVETVRDRLKPVPEALSSEPKASDHQMISTRFSPSRPLGRRIIRVIRIVPITM